MRIARPLAAAAVLALCTLPRAQAQDTAAALDQALAAYQQQDYGRCADLMSALRGAALSQDLALFAVECLAAAGRMPQAQDSLRQAVPLGRIDLDALRNKDRPGLRRLRAQPSWPTLLAELETQGRAAAARIDQPLRQALLSRLDRDQAVRRQVVEQGAAGQWTQAAPVDQDNTAWLKQVIADKGWPTRGMVGDDGARAAFLIAQHATHDPAFQRQVLAMLAPAVQAQEAAPEHLAMLQDRVLRAQGRPQRYGTQFDFNPDGSMSMQPVEDPAGLDQRRAAMGLPSIEDYRQILSAQYGRPLK